MARKGRARKSGPRHASGDIKTGLDPIAPTLLVRIVTEAKKHALDPRLGTQLGQLFMRHEITSQQAAAGFRMARIYQDFERFKGKRRTPASPSYGSGGGDHSIAEELMNEETLRDLEGRIKEANDKFYSLAGGGDPPRSGWIECLPRTLRDRLQELCVEDKYIGPITQDIRLALDQMGLFFGITSAKNATEKQAPVSSTPTLKPALRKPNLDRIYWIEVARRLRPDLDDQALSKAYDLQRALVARESFRRTKAPRTEETVETAKVKLDHGVLTLPTSSH